MPDGGSDSGPASQLATPAADLRSRAARIPELGPRLLALLSILGAALYVIVSWYPYAFYDDFGLTLDEVGINRTSFIGRVALDLLLVIIPFAFVVVVVAIALKLVWLVLRWAVPPLRRTSPRAKAAVRSLARWIGRRSFLTRALACLTPALALPGVLIFSLAFTASNEAHALEADPTTQPSFLAQILGLNWEQVSVSWMGQARPASVGDADTLVFLGHDDHDAVLWDSSLRRVLRVPYSDVSLCSVLPYGDDAPTGLAPCSGQAAP